VFVPPGVLHAQESVENDLAIYKEIKFVISDSTLANMLGDVPVFVQSSAETAGLIERIVTESVQFTLTSQACMHSYLNALLHIWAREYSSQDEEGSDSIFDTSGFSLLTKSIIRHLEDNYSGNVSIQALADKLGYNKYYICNAFKKDTGATIFDCLALIRVRHAAELISYSEMSMESVGSSVGFANVSHFSRVFKQMVGIPPGQFRRHYPAEIFSMEQSENGLHGGNNEVVKQNYAEPFIVSVLARQKLSDDILAQIANKSSDN
jgi:YesN/AraC family two-component response regulator